MKNILKRKLNFGYVFCCLISFTLTISNVLQLSSYFCPPSAEDIVSAASMEYHLPSKFLVIFSTKSRHYITGQTQLTQQQFHELLYEAGGAEGHALLYVLPITQLSPDKMTSDFSCLAPLSESTMNVVCDLCLLCSS